MKISHSTIQRNHVQQRTAAYHHVPDSYTDQVPQGRLRTTNTSGLYRLARAPAPLTSHGDLGTFPSQIPPQAIFKSSHKDRRWGVVAVTFSSRGIHLSTSPVLFEPKRTRDLVCWIRLSHMFGLCLHFFTRCRQGVSDTCGTKHHVCCSIHFGQIPGKMTGGLNMTTMSLLERTA